MAHIVSQINSDSPDATRDMRSDIQGWINVARVSVESGVAQIGALSRTAAILLVLAVSVLLMSMWTVEIRRMTSGLSRVWSGLAKLVSRMSKEGEEEDEEDEVARDRAVVDKLLLPHRRDVIRHAGRRDVSPDASGVPPAGVPRRRRFVLTSPEAPAADQ